MTQPKLTGTLIKNYFHCKRQAYLYSQGINFKNETTKMGNLLHKENKSKEFIIENIKIDDIDFEKKEVIEYKKSSANLDGSKMQLLFYLYILKEKGINFRGILKDIDFGDEYEIYLDKDNLEKLDLFFNEIDDLLKNPIPKPIKKQGCNKCSFYDYCWC